ncbi:hypothetical protein CASFOL_026475 [Castilleja foliolosa]|uniref:CCHC-type domain-containing protein n=1 Tax=Castilleja foliolosa TaxID=1961234 RepID=A0ABD3CI11_9LAMI
MENIEEFAVMNLQKEGPDSFTSLHPNATTNSTEENAIIAKILSPKTLNMNAFKSSMLKAWKPDRKTQTNLLGDNTMAFVFEDEDDLEKVLNQAWTFRDHQLAIARWPPDKSLPEIDLNKIAIWVHAFGVPVSYTNMRSAKAIGDEIGKFIKSDLTNINQKWKKSIRMQVEIDIQKPLKNSLTFSCGGRPKLMIELRYERLVDFCYSCGRIGHKLANCHIRSDDSLPDKEEQCYGPWMKIENVQIPNPKFKSVNSNPPSPSPDDNFSIHKRSDQPHDGKATSDWPIPTARQPQKPPNFPRKANSSGSAPYFSTVDAIAGKRADLTLFEKPLHESSSLSSKFAENNNAAHAIKGRLSAPPGFSDLKVDTNLVSVIHTTKQITEVKESIVAVVEKIGPDDSFFTNEKPNREKAHINHKRKISDLLEPNSYHTSPDPSPTHPIDITFNPSPSLITFTSSDPQIERASPNKKLRIGEISSKHSYHYHNLIDPTTKPSNLTNSIETHSRTNLYSVIRNPAGAY